jgi:hypothetical protein
LPGEVDDQDIKVYIKPLSEDAAFNKGVEYFTEIVFFYGVVMAITCYEVKRNIDSSSIQKSKLEHCLNAADSHQASIIQLQS